MSQLDKRRRKKVRLSEVYRAEISYAQGSAHVHYMRWFSSALQGIDGWMRTRHPHALAFERLTATQAGECRFARFGHNTPAILQIGNDGR